MGLIIYLYITCAVDNPPCRRENSVNKFWPRIHSHFCLKILQHASGDAPVVL